MQGEGVSLALRPSRRPSTLEHYLPSLTSGCLGFRSHDSIERMPLSLRRIKASLKLVLSRLDEDTAPSCSSRPLDVREWSLGGHVHHIYGR